MQFFRQKNFKKLFQMTTIPIKIKKVINYHNHNLFLFPALIFRKIDTSKSLV